MRSVFRSVLVALVAVLAVGAVASASALASPEWEVKEGGVWKTLGPGETRNVVIKSTGPAFAKLPQYNITSLRCGESMAKGVIEAEGKGRAEENAYTKCTVPSNAACEAKSKGLTAGHVTWAASETSLKESEPGYITDTFVPVGAPSEIFSLWEFGKQENTTTHKFTKSCGSGFWGSYGRPIEGHYASRLLGHELFSEGEGTLTEDGNTFHFESESVIELEGGGEVRAS